MDVVDQGRPPPPKVPSRLPVPGRPQPKKRPASSENEPPREDQKRARGPPASGKRGCVSAAAASQPKAPSAAASVHHSQQLPGRHRLSSRVRKGVVVTSTTTAAATAVVRKGEKKRAPWDLKGQLSDLQARASVYREKVQGLSGENQALQHQLRGQEQALEQAVAQNRELTGRASLLASELQVCQDQAQERLHQLTQLLERRSSWRRRSRNQAQAIGKLEEANREMQGVNRDLAARLEAKEAALHLAEGSLAQQRQANVALQAWATEQEQRLHESEMERRCLHNTVQELKGNIRVFCRVRPLLACEKDAQKGMGHLHFPPDDQKSLTLSKAEESHVGRERKDDITYEFNFDRVFPPSSSQEEVFEEIALLVQSALDGYHVCIFAYGQTGSGKTYTMEGPDEMGPGSAGVIPRAVQQIFKASREMEAKGWKYRFTANFLEIYNESLRDLLVLRPERSSELEIRRVSQSTEELHVPNLCCVPVASEEEVLKLLQKAKAHRSVAKTVLNERSSRSHSLFQLRIEGHSASRDLRTSSVLSLVDLAGSERLDKSLSSGERLKETQAINSSLPNLGLVIMALSNKEAHVPYRNSKLTYLLQNSLGGNSKMLMFVNISPLEENLAESLNSLRFARKVNECVIGTAQANRK
uniref:Kinesin-like protein n=1 Tax=Plestiodon chinensis TaxID=463516 RepID=A0A067XH81_PLECH|nr:kinesin-like protein KIFC1 [Plestiodon chinensis]